MAWPSDGGTPWGLDQQVFDVLVEVVAVKPCLARGSSLSVLAS